MGTIRVSEQCNVIDSSSVSFEERIRAIEAEQQAKADLKKREKNSPFSRWTQFNNEHTKELMILAIKYPKAHAILYFLVDQMDKYNACVCSYKVMQEVLGVSRQTISKNITTLTNLGFLAILKSGNTNIYTINDKVYWKSWGNNRQYSKFPVNVVLAMSEQEKQHQINFKNLQSENVKSVTLKNDTATDPFYSAKNMLRLKQSIADLNAGKGMVHEVNYE